MLESLVKRYFSEGALIARLPNDKTVTIGGVNEVTAPLIVAVRRPGVATRIARNPDLALGEAYMDGDFVVERGTIYDFLDLVFRNGRKPKPAPFWIQQLRQLFGPANARRASRRNVAHHYDLSDDLFALFLDTDRQYSCAYFSDPRLSLEDAQAHKKRHLAAKLRLEPGQRVLDIGCGWGGLALMLGREYGVDVDGITLSKEQLDVAQRRAAEERADNVRFALRDYRDVDSQFDRIVSVGMFEHVGPVNYQRYFDAMARLLKSDGVALLHTIGYSGPPNRLSSWTDKYIFPGGHTPSLSEIMPAIERAGLIVTDIEILRLHYAETLRRWRERFVANWDAARALYDERFCRMWEFWLAASEASFRAGGNVVFQIQLAKRNDAVPLTRDYITEFDRAVLGTSARIAAG